MDQILLANKVSPLFNVLQQNSSADAFLYQLGESMPNVSRQRVSISASSPAFSSTSIFQIPRYALLRQMCLKVTCSFADSGASTATQLSTGAGFYIAKRVTLNSHSKEILQLTPLGQHASYNALPDEQTNILKELVGYNEATISASATATTVTFYIPLWFSSTNNTHVFQDVTFLEQLSISTEWGAIADFTESAGDTCSITGADLICWYINMDSESMKSLQVANYSIKDNRPLSMLLTNQYQESEFSTTTSGAGAVTLECSLSCKNLIHKTVIAVVNDDDDSGGSYTQITSLDIQLSGRSVYKIDSNDEILLENALLYGKTSRTGVTSGSQVSGNAIDDYVVTYFWSVDPNSDLRNSGCVSLKQIANPIVKVGWTAGGAKTYKVRITHFYYSVVSASGQDGRINVGLAL